MPHDTRGFSKRGRPAEPHDERTFRDLLALERKRSDRSGRPFLLVVIDARPHGSPEPLDVAVAETIFSGLARCLRETDFIGWYEDRRRPGAVLTELGDGADLDDRELLRSTVMARGLFDGLPDDVTARMHVQVCRYPAPGDRPGPGFGPVRDPAH